MGRINRKRPLSVIAESESQSEVSNEVPVYPKKIPRHEQLKIDPPQLSSRSVSVSKFRFLEKECSLFPIKNIELSEFKPKPIKETQRNQWVSFKHKIICGKLNQNNLEELESKLKIIKDRVRSSERDFSNELIEWLITEIEYYEGEYTEIDVSIEDDLYSLAFILPSSEKGQNKLLLLLAKQQEYRGAGTYCLAAAINECHANGESLTIEAESESMAILVERFGFSESA